MRNYSGEYVGLVSLYALGILFSDDLVKIKKINPKSNFARIEYERELRKGIIQKALADLPDEERVSIEMLCLGACVYHQNYEQPDMSVGTDRRKVYMVFSKLRNLIAPYEDRLK
jgi:DNA-directed RNA polymerase specialized sigma24 family protein